MVVDRGQASPVDTVVPHVKLRQARVYKAWNAMASALAPERRFGPTSADVVCSKKPHRCPSFVCSGRTDS